MLELHGEERGRAAPLFAALPATDGCVRAGLSGEFGRLFVDEAERPTVAYLALDFHFLVGDHDSPVAREMVRALHPPAEINSSPEWEPLLRSVHGDTLKSYERVAFEGRDWDRAALTHWSVTLPDGYRLFRVGAAEVERFAAFDRALTMNFRDLAHFLRAGLGFAVEHEGEIVAGCSSFTLAEGLLEIEIDTARAHRRRGLARAAGAALTLHCLDNGLQPCWDAANEGSAKLGAQLGFTQPLRYTAWHLKEPTG